MSESTLGTRLRAARKARGWSQHELGEAVGSSQAVLQKIENGKSLRPRILEALARALDVTPAYLQFGVLGNPPLDTDSAVERIRKAQAMVHEGSHGELTDEVRRRLTTLQGGCAVRGTEPA